jgi:fumarate reductase subunit C
VLLALLFHTVTWLNLAPKAIVLHLGGRRLPDAAVLAAHYAAWLVVSAAVVWLFLRVP